MNLTKDEIFMTEEIRKLIRTKEQQYKLDRICEINELSLQETIRILYCLFCKIVCDGFHPSQVRLIDSSF